MLALQNKLEQLFRAGLAGGHYDNGAEASSDTEEVITFFDCKTFFFVKTAKPKRNRMKAGTDYANLKIKRNSWIKKRKKLPFCGRVCDCG